MGSDNVGRRLKILLRKSKIHNPIVHTKLVHNTYEPKRIPRRIRIGGDPDGNVIGTKDNHKVKVCVLCGGIIEDEDCPHINGKPAPYYISLQVEGIGWKLYSCHTSCYYDVYKIMKSVIEQAPEVFTLEAL